MESLKFAFEILIVGALVAVAGGPSKNLLAVTRLIALCGSAR
jgi:hypothetical protein